MNNRINEYLQKKGITPAELAETIGVQRSNISHILNGRNKPSFSFIQRFLESYPDIDSRWLMTGETSKNEEEHIGELSLFSKDNHPEQRNEPHKTTTIKPSENSLFDSDAPTREEDSNNSDSSNSFFLPPTNEKGKTMERIVVFYTDNTFREYKPG